MKESEEYFYKQTTLPTLIDRDAKSMPLPEKIGPYKIETLLSYGGMSLLYLGLDPKTKEPRAIKVLSPAYVNHVEMVDHFLWEAKIIALTSHPNIVKSFDRGTWEGGLYIAMEWIRGVSLSQFIMQQSFSLRRTMNIVLQIAYALCHLHTHGVIHRDLKPENILIAEDGEVKVIDFGIAQLHDEPSKHETSRILGTPSYMSPEQKENPKNVTFSSDIYALGIIAYELILGRLSYGVIQLPLLPTGLQKIIGKTIAVSPKERYQDIVDFITDLTQYYKSSEMEKDRSGGDRVLEYMEILERADQSLSPTEPPHYQGLDIGLAKQRFPQQMGLLTDSFKCANNTYIFLIAQTFSSSPTAPVSLAVLKGMMRALIQPHLIDANRPFLLPQFASALNQLVLNERHKDRYYLTLLKIIPYTDTLLYLSCGTGPLLHLPQGSKSVRTLISSNPLIGEENNATFTETSDTFYEGDLLIFHSLTSQHLPEGAPIDLALKKATQESALISPNRAAENIMKAASTASGFELIRHPKALFALQRI